MTRDPADPSERIGILGGTFDPVHVGHLMDAGAARHQLGLDRVLVVVARDPWQKQDRVVAPAAVRYEMVVAALDGVDGLEASRIELDRAGPTYTIDTVEQLAAPRRELVLIVGSDVAQGLPTWHRVDDLRERVTLAIVDRERVPFPAPDAWRVERVAVPRLELSSTDLRRRVAAGEPIDFLVPTAAARILRRARPVSRLMPRSGPVDRRERERRRDRRAQIAVIVLAAVGGVVAGRLGTHRSWERPTPTTPSTTTTRPIGLPS